MGPRRKKTKSTPQSEEPESASSDNNLQHKKPDRVNTDNAPKQPVPPESPVTPTQSANKRESWYKGGSWRAKASPVAQATRESISVAGGATSEALADGANQAGRYVHKSLRRTSTKSFPSISSESIVHATGSNAGTNSKRTSLEKLKDDKPKDAATEAPPAEVKETSVKSKDHVPVKETSVKSKDHVPVKEIDVKSKDGQVKAAATTSNSTDLKPLPADANTPSTRESTVQEATAQEATVEPPLPPEPTKGNGNSGWWGWWSRPDGYTDNAEKDKAQDDRKEASSTPLPATPAVEMSEENTHLQAEPMNINDTLHSNRSVETATSSRSWFRLWSSTQNQQQAEQQDDDSPKNNVAPSTDPPANEQAQKPVAVDPPPDEPTESTGPEVKQGQETPTNKSSGWAFWSRSNGKEGISTPNGTQRQVGELAVADTPSQSHPEAAQFNEQSAAQKGKLSGKIGRSSSLSSTASLSSPSQGKVPVTDATKPAESAKTASDKAVKPQTHPNLVIPNFTESFYPAYVPSYWERLTTYVASSLRIIDSPDASKHVFINPTPPKIKNAIAIGVHGYFPAPLIQKVLGQPTGTSIRFANYASAAIRDWVEQHQSDTPCEIETVALEGEGFIADRVATLWKLLLNWLSHLRQADLILVACHSQGVPVAIMLVHKLLQLGCLSPHARIGICAMAGVNLGPFADYKSRLLGAGAAAELFEFSRQDSRVSSEYKAALDGVLRHGVRITYCGSIDDQLVSLESSTFSTLSHPYINRCVFIDGRLHAPSFLTHLVAFALKLRNLGISDHGLIRELSLPLAGSLYGGEGHSRIYDDKAVYELALRFVLETTDALPTAANGGPDEAQVRRSSRGGPPSSVSAANSLRRGSVSASAVPGIGPAFADYEVPASGSNANPYFLPWALRGILEEDMVREQMQDEVKQLVAEFEEWKPSSKVLKDVRFRLEGVRSKL